MKELVGAVFLVTLAVSLMGGCGGGSDTPTPEYSSSTDVTDNDDGSSTYRSRDNLGGDFTCTFKGDDSDCTGTP